MPTILDILYLVGSVRSGTVMILPYRFAGQIIMSAIHMEERSDTGSSAGLIPHVGQPKALRSTSVSTMETETIDKEKPFDEVKNPPHYTEGRNYEPVEVIEDWRLDYHLGNALKYISRAGRKGSFIEDLKKAIYYLERRIPKEQNERKW